MLPCRSGGERITRYRAGIVGFGLIWVVVAGVLEARAAPAKTMTVRIHVSGGVRFDRLERFPPDLHDTGCTLIRKYAPVGEPHAYSYTLTINEAGRHLHRDTFFLTVDPYRRGQTVFNGPRAGRVQVFTQDHGKSVVVSAYTGIPGLRLRITLAPDLQSGTIEAVGMHATNGMEVGLRASMTVSWTCPVLFQERYL